MGTASGAKSRPHSPCIMTGCTQVVGRGTGRYDCVASRKSRESIVTSGLQDIEPLSAACPFDPQTRTHLCMISVLGQCSAVGHCPKPHVPNVPPRSTFATAAKPHFFCEPVSLARSHRNLTPKDPAYAVAHSNQCTPMVRRHR